MMSTIKFLKIIGSPFIFLFGNKKEAKQPDGNQTSGITTNAHGAHDVHSTHGNVTTKKETGWDKASKVIIFILLFIVVIALSVRLFLWVATPVKEFFTPKPRLHYEYTYTDNWVPSTENSRIVNFSSKYEEVTRFADQKYDLRLKFLNADSSYCVKNNKTLAEACGDAGTDVDIPTSNEHEIYLAFKTRDGQISGKLYVQAEKNVPIEHKVPIK